MANVRRNVGYVAIRLTLMEYSAAFRGDIKVSIKTERFALRGKIR